MVTAEGEPDAVAAATAVGRRWLGLDVDPAPGVAALAADPVLGPLVLARPHLRVPGSTDAFETAVLVVLGQHVSLAAGQVFAARLVAAHGTPDPVAGLRSFPTPEALAPLDPQDLQRTVGITGARARTVVAIARAVSDGTLTLRSQEDFAESGSGTPLTPRRAPDFAATRAGLLALPGVGPWTADLVALRALRDPDVFLPGDLVLRKALGGVTATAAAARGRGVAPTPLTRGPAPVDPGRHRPALTLTPAAAPGGTASRRSLREHRQWCGAPLPRRGDRPAHPEAG